MSNEVNTDVMVELVEGTIRIMMENGFTREEALQLMLSQIAVQVKPEIMQLAVSLSENHHEDFAKAEWRSEKDAPIQDVGSVEFALGPL